MRLVQRFSDERQRDDLPNLVRQLAPVEDRACFAQGEGVLVVDEVLVAQLLKVAKDVTAFGVTTIDGTGLQLTSGAMPEAFEEVHDCAPPKCLAQKRVGLLV